VRVVATMLVKASQLVNKAAMPMEFFNTEQEARKWLDEQRRKQQRNSVF
jgi:hypothetical protein